ncbi:helix-turn-helix domain-containing protein [Paenibacillus flagellatus]|uniref:HTH araC/xylS-type domain-containing protein n=1 Tax=Paenibacillus flagellatus TaxID=2211139 RepID=A0A2V5KCV6_9BACL|nr:helix-turn-helix domain-containing protein [Paenibacillus flagellatus]PYI57479.1 hypothetical protein DLM86_03335 [Paenibacillus flagellatus]
MTGTYSLKKTWFHRWVLSYISILLFIIPLIMITLLMALGDVSRKTAVESNRLFAEQLLQSLDNEFRQIDNLVSGEIAADDTMMDFFKKSLREDRFYSMVQPGTKLKTMMTAMPLIDSIYLYRHADGTVLTPYAVFSIEQFNDQKVILEALGQLSLNRPWMTVRKGFSGDEPAELISLVRYTPLFTGTDGLIIVNVRAESVAKLVKSMTSSIPSNRIAIHDRDGHPVYVEEHEDGFLKTEYRSDYLGWNVRNGVVNGNLFRIVSTLSKYWILVCLAFFLLGLVWIVLVTRKNYKPVQSIVDRIRYFAEQKQTELFKKESDDEFKIIGSALESLLDQAEVFQRQHEENLYYRRKTFFAEWLEGERPLKPEEWRREMESLELPHSFAEFVVCTVKINKYHSFTDTYSRHDQSLLKFVLTSVVKELSESGGAFCWAEWMTNDRLAVAVMIPETAAGGSPEERVKQLADDLIRWTVQHLHFGISVGIGSAVRRAEQVHESYGEAREALAYQPALGAPPVIGYWQIQTPDKHRSINPLQHIRELAVALRTGGAEWTGSFDRMFAEVRGGLYSRDEMTNLISYMAFFLQKELMELPSELHEAWTREGAAKLEEAAAEWETIDELEHKLRAVFERLSDRMSDIRSARSSYKLVQDMRAYLGEHYDNPDLSLQHLSEAFGIHGKTVSRLFKEEMGVNFIDYLSQIRIERAKELIAQSDESIQDITLRVGYLHPNTFIRSFKKQVGLTPGDYRKQVQGKA